MRFATTRTPKKLPLTKTHKKGHEMIRLVVQSIDSGCAVHVGGPIETKMRTFDIDCPELERHLREADGWANFHRQVIGAEVFGDPPTDAPSEHFVATSK